MPSTTLSCVLTFLNADDSQSSPDSRALTTSAIIASSDCLARMSSRRRSTTDGSGSVAAAATVGPGERYGEGGRCSSSVSRSTGWVWRVLEEIPRGGEDPEVGRLGSKNEPSPIVSIRRRVLGVERDEWERPDERRNSEGAATEVFLDVAWGGLRAVWAATQTDGWDGWCIFIWSSSLAEDRWAQGGRRRQWPNADWTVSGWSPRSVRWSAATEHGCQRWRINCGGGGEPSTSAVRKWAGCTGGRTSDGCCCSVSVPSVLLLPRGGAPQKGLSEEENAASMLSL